MNIVVLTVKLYAPWVHSLKEKRMIVKSLLAKLRDRFNVSAAEVSDQDVHQTIVIAIANISLDAAQADRMVEQVLLFIEQNTEAQITGIWREFR